MTKQKFLSSRNDKKHDKRTPQAPQNADEFLAAGVDLEEAGEKWRAGDAIKSCRFFVRALETYETGLQQFPSSFDLAYNRARLQFELAEQPRLAALLPQPRTVLLERSLQYSHYCLTLAGEDADALFNHGQVLSSTAEHLLEEASSSDETGARLLQESVESFDKCFHNQEALYAKQQTDIRAASADEGVTVSNQTTDTPQTESSYGNSPAAEDAWATIFEPITPASLVDTCIAQLQALAQLVPLASTTRERIAELQAMFAATATKVAAYLPPASDPQLIEWYGAEANLSAALSVAAYGMNLISAKEYAAELDRKFAYPGHDTTVESLCDSAEARTAFNEVVGANGDARNADVDRSGPSLQWQQLSTALVALARAAKLPDLATPWKIHERRAEVELLRSMLAAEPISFPQAVQNREQLLRNAEVYYRGAKNMAHAANEQAVAGEMGQKESLLQMLRGDRVEDPALQHIYEEMRRERLLP